MIITYNPFYQRMYRFWDPCDMAGRAYAPDLMPGTVMWHLGTVPRYFDNTGYITREGILGRFGQ